MGLILSMCWVYSSDSLWVPDLFLNCLPDTYRRATDISESTCPEVDLLYSLPNLSWAPPSQKMEPPSSQLLKTETSIDLPTSLHPTTLISHLWTNVVDATSKICSKSVCFLVCFLFTANTLVSTFTSHLNHTIPPNWSSCFHSQPFPYSSTIHRK